MNNFIPLPTYLSEGPQLLNLSPQIAHISHQILHIHHLLLQLKLHLITISHLDFDQIFAKYFRIGLFILHFTDKLLDCVISEYFKD